MRALTRIWLALAFIISINGLANAAEPEVNTTSPDITSANLIKEALTSAGKITDADERADTLVHICMVQARSGDVTGAHQTADSIEQPMKKNFAYGHIASAMAHAGDIDGAYKLIATAPDDAKPTMYQGVVEALARKGDIDQATQSAAKITDPFYQAHAAEDIAKAQATAGDLKSAEATIATITGALDVKVEAYAAIAELRSAAKDDAGAARMIDLAKTTLKDVPDYLAPLAQAAIASALTKCGHVAEAKAMVETAPDASARALIIGHIAEAQAEMGNANEAQATAKELKDPSDQIRINTVLARSQVKAKDMTAARRSVATAVYMVAKINPPARRAIWIDDVATVQAMTRDVPEAAKWARGQTDPQVRASALLGVVKALPNYHGPDSASGR
jgi:tetratricopeptide (TPR) repeat protein